MKHSDLLRAHYDALIDQNNDPARDPRPLRDYMDQWDGPAFLDALTLTPEKAVLEIGVGSGRLALRIAPLCAVFWGIDLSPKTITRAEENLSSCPNVTLITGDFLEYPFPRPFDVIYSSLTFFHISNKEEAIRKVTSLLTPGGRFVLSIDKNPAQSIEFGDRSVPLYPDTPEHTEILLEKAGLSLEVRFETGFAHIFVARLPS